MRFNLDFTRCPHEPACDYVNAYRGCDLPVEVRSLEDLMNFVQAVAEIIIIPPKNTLGKGWGLEIYNDYRE